MRIKALAKRILTQLLHDKRTLALMFGAPMVIMTLVYFVLGDYVQQPAVAIINAPVKFVDSLEAGGLMPLRMDESTAHDKLLSGEITATISWSQGLPQLEVDGSDPGKVSLVLQIVNAALANVQQNQSLAVEYLYGYEGQSSFDRFGPLLIGVIIFFLVFVVAGISFLQERTGGTLEKLLSTPIRRWEIVTGYTLGFGVLTVVQAVIIAWFSIYILNIMMVGSFFLVMLIALLTAMVALTLGILLSTAAHNEFQVIQFIPIVIVPQVFFTGLFDLTPVLDALGHLFPLYYVTQALTTVMIKGGSLVDIGLNILILSGFSVLFMLLNTLILKKHRKI